MKKYSLFTLFVTLTLISTAQEKVDTSFSPYEQKIAGTTVKFKMTPIPAGTFLMGAKQSDAGYRTGEGPQKKIEISAFWMGVHEVTHDEFLQYFNDESVSRNSDADAVTRPTAQYIDLSWGMGKQGGYPFNSMSQMTAMMYCHWLYKKTGIFYRLPTEAEWEYACRAGTNTVYFFGNDASAIDEYAWSVRNSKNKYQLVGKKKPNPWGLHDIIGNVAEWTLDQYDTAYYASIADGAKDPLNFPAKRYPRVVRGGGYNDDVLMMRSAARSHSQPSWNKRDPQVPKSKWWLTDAAAVGFRIVRPLKQPTAEEAQSFYDKFLTR